MVAKSERTAPTKVIKECLTWAIEPKSLSSLALTHIHYDVPVDVNQMVNCVADCLPNKLQLKSLLHQSYLAIIGVNMISIVPTAMTVTRM